MAVARIIASEHEHIGEPTLKHWRGAWMEWAGPHWTETETAAIRAELYKRLEGCHYLNKEGEPVAWLPNKTKIAHLMEAVAAVSHLAETAETPSWIRRTNADPAGVCVACANGILDVASRTLHPLTARYFNTVSVPFDYQRDAPEPRRWLAFLQQVWPDEPDSIAALQEWFGYVLSGRTDLQKMLMLVGPTRSGKGTIARILSALVGDVAGPTLLSLAGDFGLAPLLGKPLAIVADARLGRGHHVQVVVERLLSISGEDTLDVNRKYKEPWTGKIGARVMILSNELPQLGDESGAIVGRFVVLSMTNSFLGREDTSLTNELLAELPGILHWALDGLDRLTQQGAFTSAASSDEAGRVMRDMASPISAFVRDCCEVGETYEVLCDDMWKAWKEWAEDNGVSKGTTAVLGRSLRTACPSVRTIRPRVADQRIRVYAGIRLGPRWSADIPKPTHMENQAGNGLFENPEKVVGHIPDHADQADQGTCPTCDEPVGNHLPGCPAVNR